MTLSHPQGAAILTTLASALPGEFLTQCFPDYTGQEVREFLRAMAAQCQGLEKSRPLEGREASVPVDEAVVPGNTCERLTLFTDGASRGNPGLAGAGIQVLDHGQQEILAAAKFLGQCTNNEAEYQALIFGLQEARRFGGKELTVCMDSELIVRQLRGIYQVKNERLKRLYGEAKRELAHFARLSIRHVPRAQNQRADQLANRGIDERQRGR